MGLVKFRVHAVGDDVHPQPRHQRPQRLGIHLGDGHHPVGQAAERRLVAAELPPLDERIKGPHPAPHVTGIGLEGPLLEDIFRVVVVEDDQRPASRHLLQVGAHLDPLHLHHVEPFALQKGSQLGFELRRGQPQGHVGQGREEQG